MLLAYCKQIIQNQRKTVREAFVLTEELLRTFPLATTRVKVANSDSGIIVIARYRIRYFFKKERHSR